MFRCLHAQKQKYDKQERNARQRGIAWQFDFASWWAVWEASGKWDLRGRGDGRFVMSRNGDVGPYSPANVQILPARKNNSDGSLKNLGRGRGWSRLGSKYRVVVGNKHVGLFHTEEEATAAYRRAVEEVRAARAAKP